MGKPREEAGEKTETQAQRQKARLFLLCPGRCVFPGVCCCEPSGERGLGSASQGQVGVSRRPEGHSSEGTVGEAGALEGGLRPGTLGWLRSLAILPWLRLCPAPRS